jgi:hypothetical protein
VAASRPRVPNSVRVVVAVHGVTLQGQEWPHRTDSDGLTLQSNERRARGCGRPTFEGAAR